MPILVNVKDQKKDLADYMFIVAKYDDEALRQVKDNKIFYKFLPNNVQIYWGKYQQNPEPSQKEKNIC